MAESPANSAAPPLLPEALLDIPNVSRETLVRLTRYADLLHKWQDRMNLVGRETLADLWRRHFLDSAQLVEHLGPAPKTLTDLGSGAGFPGLVLAIMLGCEAHLIESNGRKAAFLREAARETDAQVEVHDARIEAVDPWRTDVVTARALAPVNVLLGFASRFRTHQGLDPPLCVFLKGENVGSELTDAQKLWNMRSNLAPSRSNPSGRVLMVSKYSQIQ